MADILQIYGYEKDFIPLQPCVDRTRTGAEAL